MAKQSSAAQKVEETTAGQGRPRPQAPQGYKKVERAKVSGYWNAEGGGAIHGRLLGKQEFFRKDTKELSAYYVFQLIENCEIRVVPEGGGPVEITTADKGELVGVFEAPGLRELEEMCGCNVWCLRGDKKPLKGNKTMWMYDVHSSGVPRPMRVRKAAASKPERETTTGEDSPDDGRDEVLPF